ncbi:alpha/beta fold hydrolase [uncultured Nonlabens sp.]|uniref:alpha/beta hydrolase family protein n=1 Tax=uncultured Nonlabens sp. TaxID=859306 RepID=UPI002621A5CC|nr:alpha/beta fold hydrolase [uncultured Nonlabens sp.]
MKTVVYFVLWVVSLLFSSITHAQDFNGSWTGGIYGMPLVFEISNINGQYSAKMQSPSQSKTYLPMNSIVVDGNQITMLLDAYKIKYQGELVDDKLIGIFTQGSGSGKMILEKKEYVEVKPKRPQEPKAPFPYHIEDVVFTNPKANDIKLAGTLTLPKNNNNPAVAILISGSGPQDRNEELFDHKPFLVLADHLTRKGIAVFRYDDRGVAQSQGAQKGATSKDFATDVEAAITYLKSRKDVDAKKIGLIGHSEGGLIAPMVIADNKRDVAFFVSLAGPGVDGYHVLLPQIEKSLRFQGVMGHQLDFEKNLMDAMFLKIIDSKKLSSPLLENELVIFMKQLVANAPDVIKSKYTDQVISALSKQFSEKWMRFFLSYDPAPNLSKIKCPVLAINGSLDYQVIPEINLPGFETALSKNKDVTIKKIKGLNHLFQNAQTGSAGEYGQLEETIDQRTLNLISSWINSRF